MKKFFTIILLSAFSLIAMAQKPKLAVYMTGDDPINEIVSSRLVDDFARGSEYTIVERTASFLSELNKEHAYERTGEVDDEQIAALGQQFGVQFVCVTSVLDVWGNEKYITARIIDAETAEVVASCSSNGSIQNKSELIGALNTLSNDFSKAVGSIKQNNAKKVAVYVTRTGLHDVDVVLGDQLVSGFAKSGRYVAIERTNVFLKKLKAEQGYQQSGAVADDDLIRWGNQSGVHYICVAKATPWGGDYWITTRMIDVKTGDVVNSSKVEGCTLKNSMDVVRVGQKIAAELSTGTLAEQAEEARLKKEAEEERINKENEAKLQAERKKEEERQKRIIDLGFVDLGLPSGTCWKNKNEEGYYTYTDALLKFANLPDIEQYEELRTLCKWIWNNGGYDVIGPNGNSIRMQALGSYGPEKRSSLTGVNVVGEYWVREYNVVDGYASIFHFSQGTIQKAGLVGVPDKCRLTIRLAKNIR